MMKIRVRDKINYERLEKQKQKELYQAKLQFFTNASHELKIRLPLFWHRWRNYYLEKQIAKRDIYCLLSKGTQCV